MSSIQNSVYELPYELSNSFNLEILGIWNIKEISKKSQSISFRKKPFYLGGNKLDKQMLHIFF